MVAIAGKQMAVAALDRWLGQQNDAANNPRLAHAMSEGKTALKALRERLN